MANKQKVTITMEDVEDGRIDIQFNFDPVINDETKPTTATILAYDIIEMIKSKKTGAK